MARRGRGGRNGNGGSSHEGQTKLPTPRAPAAPIPVKSFATSYWAIGGYFAIAACLTAAAYHHFYTIEDNTETRTSAILRNFIRPVLQSIDYKYQLDAYVLNDPLANVLKTKLRPVQERIASLKTQTSQYEQMEQIPGGPTKFIESSLDEIKTNIVRRVVEFDEECSRILQKHGEAALAFMKSYFEMSTLDPVELRLRLDEEYDTIQFLATEEGIYLFPMSDTPTEVLQKAKQEVSLEEVIAMVEQLAVLHEQLEEARLQADGVRQELELSSLDSQEILKELEEVPDEAYARIEPYLVKIGVRRMEIAEFKKNATQYLQIFRELYGEHQDAKNEATKKVAKTVEGRQPYHDLYQDILTELQNLVRRIKNLKYSYAKRKGVID